MSAVKNKTRYAFFVKRFAFGGVAAWLIDNWFCVL
jgi:hypothetical protein